MGWKTTLGTAAGALLCVALSARAQDVYVEVDASLGSPRSGPVDVVDGNNYVIGDDWGVFSSNGENRFHSFSRFDIPSGWIATFSSSASPSRVIARVVEIGDVNYESGSQIFGTLRSTIAGADLFLLNPRGIYFGDGADLDVQGSVYTSTADVLRMADGIDFEAGIAALPARLSTAEPSAFGFTSASPAKIAVSRSEGLDVPPGETLSFVGGEFTMVSRSGKGANIAAPGARVQIAAAGGPVDIPVDLADLDLADLPPAPDACPSLGCVSLGIGAEVNVSSPLGGGQPAGRILIRGGRFVLASSRLVAEHREDSVDATGPIDVAVNGGIDIHDDSEVLASSEAQGRGGDVLLSGESISLRRGASVTVGSTGSGRSGDVWLAAIGKVEVKEGASLLSNPQGEGAAGDIAVSAENLELSSAGEITMQIDGGGAEPAEEGGIEIDVADTLTVENGAQIATFNSGRAGGAIEIDAGAIRVRNAGQIVSRSQGPSAGGPITLTSAGLEVSDAGRVQSEAYAGGDGGKIDIQAESLLVSNQTNRAEGTFISTNTLATQGGGKGGDLTLRTRTLELVNGGQIFARTEGSGDGGKLQVLGADFVRLHGVDDQGRPSGITGRASQTATAEASGGSILINTRILEVDNGAQISSATFGAGSASDLTITAGESVTIRGGDEGATVVSAASRFRQDSPPSLGPSGNLTISAQTVALVDGGQVSVSTAGTQDAGNIAISADNVSISGVDPRSGGDSNPSGVFAQTNAQGVTGGGDGGDIKITARENLTIADGGEVSVRAEPYTDGDAGTITLEVGQTLQLASGGAISARSETGAQGQGGSIKITAGERVSLTGGSEISAWALGSGNAGRIAIDAGRSFESQASFVTTDARSSLGGEIEIQAAESVKLVDSTFTTSVFGEPGDGGNITIGEETIHPELVVLNHSTVKANSLAGRGGTISISADALLKSADSLIQAKAPPGLEGVVEINAPEVVLAGELATLPESFLDASALLTGACEARTARAGSFVVQRRAALPAPPDATVSLVSAGLPAVGTAPELPQCPLEEETP